MSEVRGHGAHTAWRLRRWKAILKLLPSILAKSNSQIIGTIVVIIIAAVGSIGGGIVIGGYGLQHPLNLLGKCPAPLVIQNGGCFRAIVSTTTDSSGNVHTTTSYVAAGPIAYLNGTKYG